MRTNKINDVTYTKELDEIEKYFLNILKRFFENDNAFLQDSVETIITEVLKRTKLETLDLAKQAKINNVCTQVTLPKNPKEGDGPYFNTDLGKPIWWNGFAWVDALGNNV